MICYVTVAVSAAVAPVATRWGSRFIASVVVVDNAHTATDCPRDVGRVRTCHASYQVDDILHFKSNSSPEGVYLPGYYPYPEFL